MKKARLSPNLQIADEFLDVGKFKTDMVLKELDELIALRECSIEEHVRRKRKF